MAYEQNGRRKLHQYCQNVHFSDVDFHYYIISGHNLRTYFNILQHKQDRSTLCIKQYRLLKLSHLNGNIAISPFKMFGRISGGHRTKCITQSEVFNESNGKL